MPTLKQFDFHRFTHPILAPNFTHDLDLDLSVNTCRDPVIWFIGWLAFKRRFQHELGHIALQNSKNYPRLLNYQREGTRNSATTDGPRDALCQSTVETSCTTNPQQIEWS